MPGIEHDPRSDIANIRHLLDGYAQGFAFVKELLQNADDAKASRLLLSWHPGLPEARHPLLGGPALIAINDGPFTRHDRNSLMRMGLGNKGGDSGKIGKFGLGTKSIFHVAEAFFFLESENDVALRAILNPWHPRFHAHWEEVAGDDWQALLAACHAEAGTWEHWFALWIPLRRKATLNGIEPIRNGEDAFPGDETGCPSSLTAPFAQSEPRLAELLPLLKHLREVQFLAAGEPPSHLTIIRNERRLRTNGLREENISYLEALISDPGAAESWKQRDAWPKVFAVRDDGSDDEQPDKAEWSHAALLCRSPAEKRCGRLRIFWSVFLPVGKGPWCETDLPAPAPGEAAEDISLFLHGFFFLNDSRTRILGLAEAFPEGDYSDPVGIRLRWNRELALGIEGTNMPPALLPSLPGTLSRWLDEGGLSPSSLAALTGALRRTGLWSTFQKVITSEASLLYSSDGGEWGWRLVTKAKPAAIVPGLKGERELELLKGLTQSNEEADKFFLAVDSDSAPGLVGEVHAGFGTAALRYLHGLLDTSRAWSEEEAALLLCIVLSSGVGALPPEWEDAPIFPATRQGDGFATRLSLSRLRELLNVGDLFQQGFRRFAPMLVRCCRGTRELWITSTGEIGRFLGVPELTVASAARWILACEAILSDHDSRADLISILSTSSHTGGTEASAIRYLLHARADQRANAGTRLLSKGPAPEGLWPSVFRLALKASDEEWRLIDESLTASLNRMWRDAINLGTCTRDSFPSLIHELGERAGKIDFSETDQNTLDKILTETPENALECLLPLRVHRLDDSTMAAAADESVWLDGSIQIPEDLADVWRTLRSSARIVPAAENPGVELCQRQLFRGRILDISGALKLAADSEYPHLYCALNLHLLGKAGTPRSEAVEALKNSRWMPMRPDHNGECEFARPLDILHLPGAESELGDLLKVLQCPERSSSDLDPTMRDSTGWATASSQLFRKPTEVCERLAESFGKAPDSLLLGFEATLDSDNLERWLAVVDACELEGLFLGRALLRAMLRSESLRPFIGGLASTMARTFRSDAAERYYLGCFNELRERHGVVGQEQKANVLWVYGLLLQGCVNAGRWESVRQNPSFKLLSQAGEWVEASRLAAPCPGVDRSALMDKSLAKALNLAPSETPDETSDANRSFDLSDPEDSIANLRACLEPFLDKLPHKALAILPALMAREEAMKSYAEELLDGPSSQSVIEELIPANLGANDAIGGSLRNRSGRFTYRLRAHRGETVRLDSVAGPPFNAPIERNLTHLLLPSVTGRLVRWDGGSRFEILLAPPTAFVHREGQQLREIFLASVKAILNETLRYSPPNLEEVFDRFAGLGQMSLGVCRQEILSSAPTHLQLLGVSPANLAEASLRAKEAVVRLAEAREGIGDAVRLKREADEADATARALFLESLERDPQVHEELLVGLRRRISQHQYEIDSIPFEILQNADDAVTELIAAHSGVGKSDMTRRFLIHVDGEGLEFMHGGRPINDACGTTGVVAQRWRRDLSKMLMLNGSEKEREDLAMTGKFGLGFKSVFLLCDKPHMASGSLAFDIVGGIWPRPLDPEESKTLRDHVRRYFGESPRATILRLDGPSTERIERAITRFARLVPWLPITSRSIETITVSLPGAQPIDYRWEPDEPTASDRLRIGSIRIDGSDMRHLELIDSDGEGKAGSKIQWIFALDGNRLRALPEGLPWLWVTVPTREDSLGFLLNGPFALDPGRTRLINRSSDESGENPILFKKTARLLESEFAALATEDSANGLDALGIGDPLAFWGSLWLLMTRIPHEGGTARQLADAIWPEDFSGGYSKLISRCRTLPNGLTGKMAALTSTPQLRRAVAGWLATTEGCACLEEAIKEGLTGSDKVGSYCSEKVSRELDRRLRLVTPTLHLTDLLGIEATPNVSPRLTTKLANLVGKHLLRATGSGGNSLETALGPDEWAKLRILGEGLECLSGSGSWERAESLLVSPTHVDESDEMLRSSFAPAFRVLSKEYLREAAWLFQMLRPRLDADAQTMAGWIRETTDSVILTQGLRYLATGELKQEVALKLGPEWFGQIQRHTAFEDLDPKTKESIRIVFGMAEQERRLISIQVNPDWFPDDEDEPFPPPEAPGFLTVEDLLRAWDEQEALRLFTVSGPLRELIAADLTDDQNLLRRLREAGSMDGKSAWFRLLCLGCTLDMPRGRQPAVAVRGLWTSSLGSEFWSLSAPESLSEEALEEVNRGLDPFFRTVINRYYSDVNASGEDVAFWRRVFYDFRKIHHFVYRNHLPETILAFAAFAEADGRSLITFLRSGQIPADIQDPDHPRFRGVIGQSMKAPLLFVMRELRRLGVLDERFDPACFYMNSPARRIAERLEWIHGGGLNGGGFEELVALSEAVYERTTTEIPELAAFYDLPLQLFAHSPR